MSKETKTKQPTHRVFAVKDGETKKIWTEIGAAWMHEDQGGLNVTLNFLPNAGQSIVIRARKADDEGGR